MALNIYNNEELVNQIKNIFTEDDIKIFEFNYTLYKNFKGKEENFLIDFDEVYKFIGFGRKDHAKRLLKNQFIENIHYKLDKVPAPPNRGAGNRGLNKEMIYLNLISFKLYCFLASTEQSKKIYNYYIKMEQIIHIFIENQLENNNKVIENNKKELEIKNYLVDSYKLVYFAIKKSIRLIIINGIKYL